MTRQRERTAYHEAGHAVVGFFERPHSVRRITIQPDKDCLGQTIGTLVERLKYLDAPVTDRMRRRIEQEIITLLAGAQSERRFAPKARLGGDFHDVRAASHLAGSLTGSVEATQAYVEYCQVCARDAVTVHWSEIQRVASALLKKTTLLGPELAMILKSARREAQP